MEIWLDVSSTDSSDIPEGVSRVWSSSDTDVAEVTLDDHHGQDEALSLIGAVPWILVRCNDWTMIPLENIVATASGSGTKVATVISREIDLNGAAFSLQLGVDAVLLPPEEGNEPLWAAARKMAPKINESTGSVETPRLVNASILSVEPAGVGERVCVDLIERLSPGEGMAIGSSASSLCLVHGETIPSEYVPSRPFRVNAGAIHAYVLMADGSTRYLSELQSGDEVAVLSSNGSKRGAVIGRLKIERRPFIMLRFSTPMSEGQIMLQQAETVRLILASGEAISVTHIEEGSEILTLNEASMRHIGQSVPGEVAER